MKKIILSTLTIFALTVVSQAQFKVGVVAGGNSGNQRVNVSGGSIYGSKKIKGYHAGVTSELSLGSDLYLQPQLVFSRRGATHLSSAAHEHKVSISYFEMPVYLVYKFQMPFGSLFAGAGGAFSYGIGGKEQQDGVSTKIYAGGVRNWKREDVSLVFKAGVEFNDGFFASFNSQKGLLDIHTSDAISVKNKLWSVSVGYFLNRNK